MDELNELADFLRLRAGEDMASGDTARCARGRVVSIFTGQVTNTLESFTAELRWLASQYAGHPVWATLKVNAAAEPTILRPGAAVIVIRDLNG